MWVDIYNRTKNSSGFTNAFNRMDDVFKIFETQFQSSIPGLNNILPDGVTGSITDDSIYYAVNLPGVKKEDVSVKFDITSRSLTIRGKFKPTLIKSESIKEYNYEFQIPLSFNANTPILNKVEDGILYIGFAKKQKQEQDTSIKFDVQ